MASFDEVVTDRRLTRRRVEDHLRGGRAVRRPCCSATTCAWPPAAAPGSAACSCRRSASTPTMRRDPGRYPIAGDAGGRPVTGRDGHRAERRRRPGALHPVPGRRHSAAARSRWCRCRSACRSPRQSASSTPCSRPCWSDTPPGSRSWPPSSARAGCASRRSRWPDQRDAHRRQPGGHHRRLRRPGGQLLRLHRGPHRRQRARRHSDQLRHRPVHRRARRRAAENRYRAGTPSAKVLITNLHNLTQPLIRYELTDSFTAAPRHPSRAVICGPRWRAATTACSVTAMSASTRTPSAPSGFSAAAVTEYQVRQTQRGIDVAVVAPRRPGPRRR